MECKLCDQEIKNYHPSLHHFKIDDSHAADICQECIDRFLKWQGSVFSKLFPTKALKKRYGEK